MKRVIAIIVPVLLVATAVSFAQVTPQTTEATRVGQRRVSPEGTPPAPQDTFVFVSSEMGFGGKVVKGVPYSAEAVTETVQTLADGNRIVNKTTSVLYRDSEGRTRREQSLNAIGAFVNGGEPIQTIIINDPVAGVTYALDTRTKVAHKNAPLKLEQKLRKPSGPPDVIAAKPEAQAFEYKIEKRTAPAEKPIVISPEGPMGTNTQFVLRTESGSTGYVMKTGDDSKNVVQESLGNQTIEGVLAEGTRTTRTIPAGAIGNELDIRIVSERWYSPELRMVVMSKHSDPRSGETTYRLTNINRAEPAKSLFEVPPGFTVSEGFPGVFKTTVPAKIKKQPE